MKNYFLYKNDQLHCEDVPLERLAAEVGTPVYVYSQTAFTNGLAAYNQALGLAGLKHLVCYSVKVAGNLALLSLAARWGCGADIVSGGELHRALAAGIPAGKIVFSGVGKTGAEMAAALKAGILMFNVESEPEMELLADTAQSLGLTARIALRINPDVDPGTHPYIATGLKESKFGLPVEQALNVYKKAAGLKGLQVVGLDCHIGSQLTSTAPFVAAAERLNRLLNDLNQAGLKIDYFDLGGGLGITYNQEQPPSPAEYVAALAPLLAGRTVILEPGRSVAGCAGALLTRALYNKRTPANHFVIVDAAMNDLIRPSLYGAYHPIWPLKADSARAAEIVQVVGPVCESGDFLARDRELPAIRPGEYLAVGGAGAYGFVMSSNYNARPRAAEVLVKDDQYKVIRPRETYDDLIRGESRQGF